jgi:hypothetical protein
MADGRKRIKPAVGLNWLADYVERHNQPLNAALHIVGVPAVMLGLGFIFASRIKRSDSSEVLKGDILGLLLIVLGYVLQYLGHRSQGNEVGEVILLKKIWRALKSALVMPFLKVNVRSDGRSYGGNGNSNGNGNGSGHGHKQANMGDLPLLWWRKGEQ